MLAQSALSGTQIGRPYEQDDAFRSRHIIDGVLSPDGSFVIYALSETVPGKTRSEDKQCSSLWQIDVTGGEPKRLTAKGKNVSAPQMTPDGRAVVFLSVGSPDAKVTQVYRLPLDGGEAEEITSLEQGVVSFSLSPDGELIAFIALEKIPKPAEANDHVRIDRLAYRLEGIGYLRDAAQAIYVISSRGDDPKALTAHDGIVVAIAWSPNSREIAAAIAGRGAAHKPLVDQGELCILDLRGQERKLLDTWVSDPFWTADGKQIGYVADPDNTPRQGQLFLIDRAGGSPVGRTAELNRVIGRNILDQSPSAVGSTRIKLTADGTSVLSVVGNGGENGVYKIALSGAESCEPILSGPRVCKILDLVGTTLVFSAQDHNTPTELWMADLDTKEERALTNHNAQWHSQVGWPELERIIVTSAPEVSIEGWVMKPSHGKAPFKTVLAIHGGPHGAFGYSFNEDYQELVGAGYAVAFANPRGSTGYGDAFSTAIVGRFGYTEAEDLMAFLDEVVERGIADPEKLGVTGVSYGGYMSGWLLGHTDRFKAIIPEQGDFNMFSSYGVSDAGIAIGNLELGGAPHENVQRYWDLSPIAYAHTCKAPVLLIQGESDLRCPMEEAEQMFAVLKYNGCEAEFLRLKDCGHGIQVYGPPPLRRFRMDAIKDWFDRYIR